jgi:hypothetical protein
MEEITFQVQRDEQSGRLVASWDDPAAWAASPRKDKIFVIYSCKSRMPSQFISTKTLFLVGSASE